MFILSGVFFLMAQLSLKLCAISNVYIANSIIFRPSNSIHTLLCTVYHTLLCTVYLVRYRRPWMCVCDTKCFVFSPFLSIPSLPLLAFSPLQYIIARLNCSRAVDGKSLWTIYVDSYQVFTSIQCTWTNDLCSKLLRLKERLDCWQLNEVYNYFDWLCYTVALLLYLFPWPTVNRPVPDRQQRWQTIPSDCFYNKYICIIAKRRI